MLIRLPRIFGGLFYSILQVLDGIFSGNVCKSFNVYSFASAF